MQVYLACHVAHPKAFKNSRHSCLYYVYVTSGRLLSDLFLSERESPLVAMFSVLLKTASRAEYTLSVMRLMQVCTTHYAIRSVFSLDARTLGRLVLVMPRAAMKSSLASFLVHVPSFLTKDHLDANERVLQRLAR